MKRFFHLLWLNIIMLREKKKLDFSITILFMYLIPITDSSMQWKITYSVGNFENENNYKRKIILHEIYYDSILVIFW